MSSISPDNPAPIGLWEFVTRLLRELDPCAELVALDDGPLGHYTVRAEISGEIGKPLILSKTLLEAAPLKPAALGTVLFLFQTELLRQETRRLVDRTREAQWKRTARGVCAICGKPFRVYERVVIRWAKTMHARCEPIDR